MAEKVYARTAQREKGGEWGGEAAVGVIAEGWCDAVSPVGQQGLPGRDDELNWWVQVSLVCRRVLSWEG